MRVEDCRILDFPKITDARGNLTVIEAERHVPFAVKRVFYLYDVPPGETRGGHAHRQLEQVMVCVAGACRVELDDGERKRCVRLDSPLRGLYVPPMVWEVETNFEPGSICLVLASDVYSEPDYYRDYAEYVRDVTDARRRQLP